MADTELTVIIVSWNVRAYLDACLNALGLHNPIPGEVIVVDNASSDGTADFISKKHPRVKVIAGGENLGFARANNLGVKSSSGRVLLFLNPDTLMQEDVVSAMFKILQTNPEVGCVGCKLIDEQHQIDYHCAKRFPTILNVLFEPYFRKLGVTAVPSYTMLEWDHLDSRKVPCLSGACLMVRRSVLEEVGPWNEEIFMYGEDVELCWRIAEAGWLRFYLAEVAIIHYGRQSTNQNLISIHAESIRSLRKFFTMHRSAVYGYLFEFITVIDYLLKYLLFSMQGLVGKQRARQSIRLYRQLAGELLRRP